jgi:hypothetical protein
VSYKGRALTEVTFDGCQKWGAVALRGSWLVLACREGEAAQSDSEIDLRLYKIESSNVPQDRVKNGNT